MLYFSEIKNKPVVTDDGVYVGKLKDLVFTFKDIAKVSKLLVQSDILHTALRIPVNDVVSFDDKVVISKGYVDFDLQENELYVGKNLIDKQIIDIEGRKVVRVNDAVIQIRRKKNIYITGVDIGLAGVLRWLKIESVGKKLGKLIGYRVVPHILSWKDVQPLELAEGRVVLNTQMEKLESFHPEDLADYLETTDIQNMIKTLDLVDKEFASEVIAELNLNYQIAIFEQIGIRKTLKILELMDPDEAVDVLLQFRKNKREKLLSSLPKEKQTELMGLIEMSQTTVGQYMTSEFLYVYKDETVTQINKKVKKYTEDFDFLFYIYVVNKQQQLIGVFSLHELLLQKANTKAHKFMHRNIVLAYLNTPIQTVIKRMITYKFYGLPVVGRDKKLVGTILLDDIDEILLDELQ